MFTVTGGQQAKRNEAKDLLGQAPTTYDDGFVKITVAV